MHRLPDFPRRSPLRRIPSVALVVSLLLFPGATGAASVASPSTPAPDAFFQRYLRYSAMGSRDLLGVSADSRRVEEEISVIAGRIRNGIPVGATGEQVVSSFRRVLLEEEGFVYDGAAGNPENFLLDRVLARRRGNCLGMTMLYLAVAERLSVPFRGVCLPSHCFARFDGGGWARNVEFASGGADWEDDRYRKEFRIGPGRPYLGSIGGDEMLGVFLKSLGAAYSKKGREVDALRFYDEAVRFFPDFPQAHYNAGVSLQVMGKYREAAGKYREALALDPGLAQARDNLGIVLAIQGRFDEAVAEGRRATELEPGNAAMRGNLASTYVAAGNFNEGAREFRKALEIDPWNIRARAGLARAERFCSASMCQDSPVVSGADIR